MLYLVIYEINNSYVNILLYVLYVQFWSPCCMPYMNMCIDLHGGLDGG